MNANKHIPVLLKETIEALNIKPNGVYVDATFGRGGHSAVIYSYLNLDGKLIIIDQDQEAISHAKKIYSEKPNVIICKNNFKNIKSILKELNIEKIDGILSDFGPSSPQFDDAKRGFSFHQDATLDMRMDLSNPISALKIINEYDYASLIKIFKKYGEISWPNNVVQAIIKYRDIKPITTTFELVEIIKNNISSKELYSNKHPARLYFQALRIAVNNELDVIEIFLNDIVDFLNADGRICVITFHSLEEKIVNKFAQKYTTNPDLSYLPININSSLLSKYSKKPIKPSTDEINFNTRSRSAKLFAFIKS